MSVQKFAIPTCVVGATLFGTAKFHAPYDKFQNLHALLSIAPADFSQKARAPARMADKGMSMSTTIRPFMWTYTYFWFRYAWERPGAQLVDDGNVVTEFRRRLELSSVKIHSS